jgi:hypothetical protein
MLATTCETVALSLAVWTNKSSTPIFGVIGQRIYGGFHYQEGVIEFAEVHEVHTGGNMADHYRALEGLGIEHKVLTITVDNAINNESLMSEQ